MTDPELSVNEEADTVEETPEQALTDEESLQNKLKEAIAVAVEDVGALRRKVTISVPRATIDEQLSEQFDELKHEASVPGFRKGRAPLKLLEKRFGGDVGDQVGASLIGNSYLAAIDKEGLDIVGDPLLHVTFMEEKFGEGAGARRMEEVQKLLPLDQALEHMHLPKEGDLTFSCEVDIRPTFDLPELKGIPVRKRKLKITKRDVDDEVRRLLKFRGSYYPVESGSIEIDDLLVGTTRLIVDGNVVDTQENAELHARDQWYQDISLDGFGKQAVGSRQGDTVAVSVTVPDDHTDIAWRGKSASFELTISEVKRLSVPAVDQEWLSAMGFESEEELREDVKQRLEALLAFDVLHSMRGQIVEFLVNNTKVDVPSGVSQRQTARIVASRMMELYSRGVHESEIAKHIDELRTVAAGQVEQEIKRFFIMEKIAEELDVDVTEEELNGAIAQIAERRDRRFDRVRDEIIRSKQLGALYLRLRDHKILERLLADADVTEEAPARKAGKNVKAE